MPAWVRFLHDDWQPARAYVCWTSPGFEQQITVHGGHRGDALRQAAAQFGDLVCIDWDIAYDSIDMRVIDEHVAASPEVVAVGPYEMFVAASWRDNFGWEDTGERPGLVWSGQVLDHGAWRRITESDSWCQSFGLGFTYLPASVIGAADAAGVLERVVYPYDDRELSAWFSGSGQNAAVLWAATPKHLHFDLPPLEAAS